MSYDFLRRELKRTFHGLPETLPSGRSVSSGKVRDMVDLGSELLISTSDRISAFDHILSTIPCKGEVLNRIALFWFEKTKDIVPNHIVRQLSARTVAVKKCEVLPVEVVVRGYLTGSAWRDYQAGKPVSGIELPEGMRADQAFDPPLITPSTKAEQGLHDEPISCEAIVDQGLVEESLWNKVEETALALFARGSAECAARGLILVDTKYEFGLLDGELVLVDEIHTPDSSRFWFADRYSELFQAGKSQLKLDKEYLRQWLIAQGFMGDGVPPEIPDEVRIETARRYVEAFEKISGMRFEPAGGAEDEAELIDRYQPA